MNVRPLPPQIHKWYTRASPPPPHTHTHTHKWYTRARPPHARTHARTHAPHARTHARTHTQTQNRSSVCPPTRAGQTPHRLLRGRRAPSLPAATRGASSPLRYFVVRRVPFIASKDRQGTAPRRSWLMLCPPGCNFRARSSARARFCSSSSDHEANPVSHRVA